MVGRETHAIRILVNDFRMFFSLLGTSEYKHSRKSAWWTEMNIFQLLSFPMTRIGFLVNASCGTLEDSGCPTFSYKDLEQHSSEKANRGREVCTETVHTFRRLFSA